MELRLIKSMLKDQTTTANLAKYVSSLIQEPKLQEITSHDNKYRVPLEQNYIGKLDNMKLSLQLLSIRTIRYIEK